jgi:hypothetical protein
LQSAAAAHVAQKEALQAELLAVQDRLDAATAAHRTSAAAQRTHISELQAQLDALRSSVCWRPFLGLSRMMLTHASLRMRVLCDPQPQPTRPRRWSCRPSWLLRRTGLPPQQRRTTRRRRSCRRRFASCRRRCLSCRTSPRPCAPTRTAPASKCVSLSTDLRHSCLTPVQEAAVVAREAELRAELAGARDALAGERRTLEGVRSDLSTAHAALARLRSTVRPVASGFSPRADLGCRVCRRTTMWLRCARRPCGSATKWTG